MISALSSVFTYLVNDLEIIEGHPIRKIDSLTEIKNHTPAYTCQDVKLIKKICKDADKRARMNNEPTFDMMLPLVTLFSETGIRKTFLEQLRWDEIENLNGDDPVIHKLMKGQKEVFVALTPLAVKTLKELHADAQFREPTPWVFPSPMNRQVPVSGWHRRFRRLTDAHNASECEVKITDTPKPVHSFRAHVATRMAEKGASTNVIADQLGTTLVVAEGYRNRSAKQRDNARKFLT